MYVCVCAFVWPSPQAPGALWPRPQMPSALRFSRRGRPEYTPTATTTVSYLLAGLDIVQLI